MSSRHSRDTSGCSSSRSPSPTAIGWLRGRPHRERDPALADGYRSIALGIVALGSVPWLVMGAAVELGGLTLERFLRELHSSKPWGRAFVTSLFAV